MEQQDYLDAMQKIVDACKDAHKIDLEHEIEQRKGCPRDKSRSCSQEPRMSPLKQYTINLDGEHDHIMGEGLYKQEDGDVVIYSDVRKGVTAAIIRNFDYITIFECPEEEDDD
jgi:hypothetical protein